MSELMSNEAVCRTAPATPGLLNMQKKHVKIIKMHNFSSLGVHISRFRKNSAKFCAVARLHDGNI